MEIKYSKDGDMICATFPDFKNLQESIVGFGKTEEEAKTDLLKNSKVGFCTIFKKKNNRAITTFKTVGVFTEEHGKAYAIDGGILGSLGKRTESEKKQMTREILNFVKGKLDSEKDKILIEGFKKTFKLFDEKYRVLIG